MFQITFILIAYFDWLLGPQKGQIFGKKIFKNLLFLQSHWRYSNFIFREMFIEY